MPFNISQLGSSPLATLATGVAVGAVAGAVAGAAGQKHSEILSATKDYTLRRSANGRLSVHRRTPKRRFRSRSTGGQSMLNQQFLMLALLSRGH